MLTCGESCSIWYQYCLLALLRPFVSGTESLVGGGTPALSRNATPGLICRQSSEAVIFLTSTYQTRYSLKHPSPLLPYMVFAAVLHQLTLVVEPQYLDAGQRPVLTRTAKMPPPPASESPIQGRSATVRSNTPAMDSKASAQADGHSVSPTMAVRAQREARRRAFGFSSTSVCPSSGGSDWTQPSSTGCAPSTASDNGGRSSSESSVDILPVFTSASVDLVTVGSMQLVSMGVQHSGAASTARLLQSIGPVDCLVGSNINLATWAASLPGYLDDFHTAVLCTGLGLQKAVPGPVGPMIAPGGLRTAVPGTSRGLFAAEYRPETAPHPGGMEIQLPIGA